MVRTHLLALLGLLALAPHAFAATFTANSSLDLPDDNPGDGVCRSSGVPLSTCTLRAAIMEANALAGEHVIALQSGRTYNLTRAGDDDVGLVGDLDITKSLAIHCPSCAERPVVNAAGINRAFDIHAGTVDMEGFDIRDGAAQGTGGGAIRAGAGATELALMFMRLYDNESGSAGGAIRSSAQVTRVQYSELHDNVSVGLNGTAISKAGGGTLVVTGSSINGHRQALGSDTAQTVHLDSSDVEIRSSTISSNLGGGLFVFGAPTQVEIRNATIVGHSGEGLTVLAAQLPHPQVRVRNSIIARNAEDCAFNFTIDGHGYNLYGDSSCNSVAGPTDWIETNPLLTPLKRRPNSPTATSLHWPSPTSVALSNGAIESTPAYGCESFDQNLVSRPQGYNGSERCDIGAAEVPDDAIFFDSLETL